MGGSWYGCACAICFLSVLSFPPTFPSFLPIACLLVCLPACTDAPLLDIVFVHGIRGGAFATWRRDGVLARGQVGGRAAGSSR